MVLQACRAGGFILPPELVTKYDTLRELENVEVLTAARADRVSLGCQSGEHRTYYGTAFLEVLERNRVNSIAYADWATIHTQVSQKIATLERDLSVPKEEASLPQFYADKSQSY